MKHGLVWSSHPLQFGLLIQVGCPVDQVKGSKEQREGYSGNPVYLAHTVKGLLGLWRLGLWLLLGLSWGWWGAFGNSGQSRVPGNIGGEGCSSGGWVGCSVVLLEEGLLFFLLLIFVLWKEKKMDFRFLKLHFMSFAQYDLKLSILSNSCYFKINALN